MQLTNSQSAFNQSHIRSIINKSIWSRTAIGADKTEDDDDEEIRFEETEINKN